MARSQTPNKSTKNLAKQSISQPVRVEKDELTLWLMKTIDDHGQSTSDLLRCVWKILSSTSTCMENDLIKHRISCIEEWFFRIPQLNVRRDSRRRHTAFRRRSRRAGGGTPLARPQHPLRSTLSRGMDHFEHWIICDRKKWAAVRNKLPIIPGTILGDLPLTVIT